MPTDIRMREKPMDMDKVKVINIVASGPKPMTGLDGLALLFIGLKLTDHLQDWNWYQVLAPIWVPFVLTLIVKLAIIAIGIGNNEEE